MPVSPALKFAAIRRNIAGGRFSQRFPARSCIGGGIHLAKTARVREGRAASRVFARDRTGSAVPRRGDRRPDSQKYLGRVPECPVAGITLRKSPQLGARRALSAGGGVRCRREYSARSGARRGTARAPEPRPARERPAPHHRDTRRARPGGAGTGRVALGGAGTAPRRERTHGTHHRNARGRRLRARRAGDDTRPVRCARWNSRFIFLAGYAPRARGVFR